VRQAGQKAGLKLGIISDTHARSLDGIPAATREALAGVDLIVHAGDFTSKAVLDGLWTIGQVRAVSGNMDPLDLRAALPERDVFEAGGKKIGLVHGWGAPWGIAERVRKQFAGVDIVIFGHSHLRCNRLVEGVLLVNPGPGSDSYALLTIDGDGASAEMVRV